jgi:hypothetical protein
MDAMILANNPIPPRSRARCFTDSPRRGEYGALGAFPLHMKIARGITAGPAILGRANKSNNDTPMKSVFHDHLNIAI